MAEDTTSPWVVVNERSSSGLFSSVKCFFAQTGRKKIYGPYERPPFPIKIDKPTFGDMVSSVRASDFVLFGSMYGTGILWSWYLSRPYPIMS